ncbi:HAD-IIIA family hydrolase [Tissierella sp.]|uniref:HAD-IIIA family hydrolase n=1 Tax=Tissierella sp. TaxID=41274 RepID=UPI002862F200|nr:HAD-IIIA family hydrolase [Tissierella sp.]MDR7856749.1 HAD-IIIA family hydrolase [Tissierella sp.]
MLKIEAVFLDRDGTIGGDGHFIHPNEFQPYENFFEAIEKLKEKEIKIFAFTNQHRIYRGEAKVEDFRKEFEAYGFTDSYICPHEMNSSCECQKPKPGMLIQAAKDYNLNLANCVVIGDVGTDMMAANSVGAIRILVKTGWGEGSLNEYRHLWKEIDSDYIADDILDAINWLMSKYC